MKQLHWEKIELSDSDSVWKAAKTEALASELMERGIFDEIETIFAAKDAKKLASKKKEDINKLSFLSREIAQQFSINLHSLNNLSDEDVVKAILRCDPSVIENAAVMEFLGKEEIVEITHNMARNFEPFSTDHKLLEDSKPDKDPNMLQRPDRVYLELMYNLQHYWKSRIRGLVAVTTFEKDYEDLVRKLRAIDEAVSSLYNSQHLKTLFEIILAVGNYMNDSSKQALGFKLSSLQRLSFIKDDKNSMTFLHYVEKIVRTQYPIVLSFIDDLQKCVEIEKFSIETIMNDCREFTQGIKNVQKSIDIGNLSDLSQFHPEDKAMKVILPALPKAVRKGELLQDQANCTIKEFERAMRYFGEDPSDTFVKNSFIGKFANFLKDFKKVHAENKKRDEDIRLYEQRMRALDKPQSQHSGPAQVAEEDDNVMDSLLEKLKVGSSRGEPSSARRRALRMQHFSDSLGKNGSPPNVEVDREIDVFSSTRITAEPVVKLDSLSETNSGLNTDGKAVGSRARLLLQEIRGDGDASLSDSVTPVQKFRDERQRNRTISQDNEDVPDTSVPGSPSL